MLFVDQQPHTTMLCYDEFANQFMDEDGFPVLNIHEFITPNQLYLFQSFRQYMLIETSPGVFVELIWPDSEEDVYWADLEYPREYDEEDIL